MTDVGEPSASCPECDGSGRLECGPDCESLGHDTRCYCIAPMTSLTEPMPAPRTGRKVTVEELERMRDSGTYPPDVLQKAIDRARLRARGESTA